MNIIELQEKLKQHLKKSINNRQSKYNLDTIYWEHWFLTDFLKQEQIDYKICNDNFGEFCTFKLGEHHYKADLYIPDGETNKCFHLDLEDEDGCFEIYNLKDIFKNLDSLTKNYNEKMNKLFGLLSEKEKQQYKLTSMFQEKD